MYKIQDVEFNPKCVDERVKYMYHRGNSQVYTKFTNGKKELIVKEDSFLDFFTYFNALSVEKWKLYTYAKDLKLIIEAKGEFRIRLFGHWVEKNGYIGKEQMGVYEVKTCSLEKFIFTIPSETRCSVVSFSFEAISDVVVDSCYYATEVDDNEIVDVFISLVTTTFKKESYIKKNMTILNEYILNNDEFKKHFCWKIVDNGSTLEERLGEIEIVHNKNVGGAGGFSKGMIMSLRMEKKPTHILFMDDDVSFSPESFRRTYRLLSILRPEYKDCFLSGAMLNMEQPNIQHENTGILAEEGYCIPISSGYDLCLWDKVVLNEVVKNYNHQYAAWWFCCIPTTVANLDNLPMPLFVRGDDMEYSLRNNARIITLNGISIWHQSFGGRFDMVTEYYQSKRNELVVFSSNPAFDDIDTFGFIEKIFWQELYKFNYEGAELLIDAVEDYMKGPEWLFGIDMFEEIKKRRGRLLKSKKITDDIRKKIDYEKLYVYETPERMVKLLYDYTYNGQSRIPQFVIKKKEGVIPFGGAYLPNKQLLTNKNYVIDPVQDVYYEYIKDVKRFKKIKERYISVKSKYICNKEYYKELYRKDLKRISNIEFWDRYLEL